MHATAVGHVARVDHVQTRRVAMQLGHAMTVVVSAVHLPRICLWWMPKAHRFWAVTANRALPPGPTVIAAGHARRVDARITRRRTLHPEQRQPPQVQNVCVLADAATAQIQIKYRANPARNAVVDRAEIAHPESRASVISEIESAKA